MNADDATPPERICEDHPATPPEPGHDKRVDFGAWRTKRSVLFELNEMHGGFRRIFFDHFRALLEETNDEAYVDRMADYVLLILFKYMFVRVERPRGSKHFVLGYVKCDRVFSFVPRFEQMRVRLSRVLPRVLRDMESDRDRELRLACVGETDYERAYGRHFSTHTGNNGMYIILTPLAAAIYHRDEDAAEALLDGGDDPNDVDDGRGNDDFGDEGGRNALHWAAKCGCRLPLFHRILGMIQDVNAGDNEGYTALMLAAWHNRLDIFTALMNHPGIDVHLEGEYTDNALYIAVRCL